MTDRNLGQVVNLWVGTVTNVADPAQSGRVQVRVFGRHDDTVNIPDASLPWAQVLQPVTSAARGRIGTAPVGVVAGSRVMGLWLDADHQYPVVLGTIGRSGTVIEGQTEGGAPRVDTNGGSIPTAAVGAAQNPYAAVGNENRVTPNQIDSRQADIDSVPRDQGAVVTRAVEEGMANANAPTTASADRGETNVLDILRSVDPTSSLASLPCLTNSAFDIKITIDLGSIAAGFINMLTDAMTDAILQLADQLGINNVLQAINLAAAALQNFQDAFDALSTGGLCAAPRALNSMQSGTQALSRSMYQIQEAQSRVGNAPNAIRGVLGRSAESIVSNAPGNLFRPISVAVSAPVGYTQRYFAANVDPYPGYIRWDDPTNASAPPVFTLRNGQPNFTSPREHTTYEVGQAMYSSLRSSISTGSLDTLALETLLTRATGIAQISGLNNALGYGFNPVSLISLGIRLVPTLVSNISNIFNAKISVSVLDNREAIDRAVGRFTEAQTVLARRRASLENAFRRI